MLWASQAHIADIFEIERSVVTKHIRNILKNKELDENSVRAKLAHTAEDGKSYQVQLNDAQKIIYCRSQLIKMEIKKEVNNFFKANINANNIVEISGGIRSSQLPPNHPLFNSTQSIFANLEPVSSQAIGPRKRRGQVNTPVSS